MINTFEATVYIFELAEKTDIINIIMLRGIKGKGKKSNFSKDGSVKSELATIELADTHAPIYYSSSKRELSKKIPLFVAITLFCLLLAGGAWSVLNDKKHAEDTSSGETSSQDDLNSVEGSIYELRSQIGSSKSASDVSREFEKRANEVKGEDESIAYYSAAIITLLDAGNTDEALATANRFEATKHKGAFTAENIALVYKSKGDYARAAEYYGIAAERSEQTSPNQDSPYNQYLKEKAAAEERI